MQNAKPKQPKTPLAWQKRLDVLAREILRIQSDNTCEYCGEKVFGQKSHPHHIRSRRFFNTRWELFNLVHLCAKCHRAYHDGVIGKDWWKEKFPACSAMLQDAQHEPTKTWRKDDYAEVEKRLLQILGE